MNENTQQSNIPEDNYPVDKLKNKAIIINRNSYIDPSFISFPIQAEEYIESIVIANGLINDRIEKLANQIIEDYNNKKLTVLVIMKGAVVFANSLQAKISEVAKASKKVRNDINYEYITISSYSDDKSTGKIKLKSNESILTDLKDENVLVVEDMFDSGNSLFLLDEMLKQYNFKSLKYAILFLKKNEKNIQYIMDFDYLGFAVPNDFMVGFGLDYNECFRDLQHLCTINKKGIEKFKKAKK